jgi:hypothetical protein
MLLANSIMLLVSSIRLLINVKGIWRLTRCLLAIFVCSSLRWVLAVLALLCCCMRAYV